MVNTNEELKIEKETMLKLMEANERNISALKEKKRNKAKNINRIDSHILEY